MSDPIRTVGCLIINQDTSKILLIHRNTHAKQQWEIPGGKIKQHESDTQALTRECLEELGVQITVGDLLTTISYWENDTQYQQHMYLCRIQTTIDTLTLEEGFDDASFFSLDELTNIHHQLSAGATLFVQWLLQHRSAL